MRRFSALAHSLMAIGLVSGGLTAAGQIIIRGNGGRVVIADNFTNGPKKAEPDPAGPHLIEFFDGRQLHGTLEAMDLKKGEITWRRADASAPLTIPTMLIDRLTFVPSAVAQNEFGMELEPPRPAAAPPASSDGAIRATVKFGGSDWLRAEVTNIVDNKVHLKLSDGSPLVVDRAQVEWIYFAKDATPECYDGPTSIAGWSGGGWSYRDGALRATTPSQITRSFSSLPDQVEYEFVADQGNLMSQFNFSLHGRGSRPWGGEPGIIQCMLRASTLTVFSNADGHYKNDQVDLTKKFGNALDGRIIAGRRNPVHFRLYEDYTGGRITVFINEHKAGEWAIQKGEAGKNSGAFTFQPTIWNPNSEQTLSKIRVVPWDGRIPEDGEKAEAEASSDHVSLADGTAKDGKFIDLAAGTVRLRVDGSDFEAANAQVKMLRFAHRDGAATPPAPSVAHVLLTEGGEFDATDIGWREGKMQIATRFGSDLPVSTASVAEVNFLQSPPPLAAAEDVLVFENGDRLKGKLEMAEENQKVRWRTDESAQPVEFEPAHVSGVRGGWSEEPRKGKIDSVVRFRNGDWLAGRFLTLDKDQIVLDTPDAGQLTISRELARTLYFSPDGRLPISDGAADDREWLKGLDLGNNQAFSTRRRTNSASSVKWKSFDGAFSLLSVENPETVVSRAGGIQIGRLLDSLPSLVEVSFDVSGVANQIIFSAQLFTEPSNSGYFMQLHSQGLYIYDLNPGERARGMVPQQIQFDGKLKPDANHRHVQLLANRDTGQLTVLVDGVVITHFGTKPGTPPRQLGRGLMLSPQINIPCTFSNIWIAPWNGRVPGKTPASDDNQDTAILTNGDEAPGTVEIATPTSVKLASEVGPLELPLERVTMIDFGGAPVERTLGARLHLAGAGALTVGSYHVENDTITCRSEMVGDLRLPLHAVQELVFSASKPLPEKE